jgi:hypothetical protein
MLFAPRNNPTFLNHLTPNLIMPLLFLTLLLCSCSPKNKDNNALPNYEMMQAAEDAGKTPSSKP